VLEQRRPEQIFLALFALPLRANRRGRPMTA